MPADIAKYYEILEELSSKNVDLVAVSKVRTVEDILALYNEGQRDFGENYVQELDEKQQLLPHDIRWHFIGHLQTNKVKYIAPYAYLVHGVDTLKLLKEISKQAAKNKRSIKCLLQIHVAQEQSKFGLNEEELDEIIDELKSNPLNFKNILVCGLMGMATNTGDTDQVRKEFRYLKHLYDQYKHIDTQCCHFSVLSMGMSDDYRLAVEEGSTMVRIGSLLFGRRI